MIPTVGRIVHFYPDSDHDELVPHAALITAVTPDPYAAGARDVEDAYEVTLHVFFATGVEWPGTKAPFSEKPQNGCWSWPPRV